MTLIIRTPRSPDAERVPENYPTSLDVLDGDGTAAQRQLRRGGLAQFQPATLAAALAVTAQSPPGGAFFDIGAGIGVHSALVTMIFQGRRRGLRRIRGVRCWALEPTPATAAVAEELAQRNGLDYTVVPTAVSDVVGSGTLYLSNTTESSNSLNPTFRESVGELVVPVTTVDAFADQVGCQPFLIKIDAQTYEPRVLEGAQDTIATTRPWIICPMAGKADRSSLTRMLGRLEQLGYSFHVLSPTAPWASGPAADFRALRAVGEDWLLAPGPLTAQFRADVRGWLGTIAECGRVAASSSPSPSPSSSPRGLANAWKRKR